VNGLFKPGDRSALVEKARALSTDRPVTITLLGNEVLTGWVEELPEYEGQRRLKFVYCAPDDPDDQGWMTFLTGDMLYPTVIDVEQEAKDATSN
jgi:hypothetical protein